MAGIEILFLPAALLLIAALFVLWLSTRQRRASGLPSGRVVYTDTGQKVEKPLYDPITGLTGKPDYLVEEKGYWIPVEVKSSRAPVVPYDSHVYQLAAYCLLVESTHGKRPPYGILRYRDQSFSIAYTPELQRELEQILADMRTQERTLARQKANKEIDRSHNEAGRCTRCGFRKECDQRL